MAKITPLEVLRLSTDDLPLHERFPFWREVFGQSIVRTDFDTVNSSPFRATATLHAFDELGIALGTTAGLRASRGKSLLTDGADDLLILANLAGSCLTSYRGGDLEIGTGEAIMRSSAEVGSTIFPGPNRILNLRIPRRVMAARMAAPEDAFMRRIPANTEALRLLINYVVTTVETHQIATADLRQLFATHVHDLVALAIGASRDATELASGRAYDGQVAVVGRVERAPEQPDHGTNSNASSPTSTEEPRFAPASRRTRSSSSAPGGVPTTRKPSSVRSRLHGRAFGCGR